MPSAHETGINFNSPELPDSSHSEDRLGGLFSYMPTTEQLPSLSRSRKSCESAPY
ncbi:TPA: hypothetical protein QH549_000344 [Proteus mirabilis]|nr:hypothetical protein [Proteus mirabilis]